jgi:hypothetical protein
MRVFCCQEWPNGRWEGFRIAIFDFGGSVPGSILWPANGEPKWVKPDTDAEMTWCDFDVLWVAYPHRSVLAAQEQFYDWPECDTACFDDGSGPDHGRTWFKAPWTVGWISYEGSNLMLRLHLDLVGRVSPSSLGRVKALYR